ncbi:Dna2/Cas4 domain-containing protein [Methanobrevibacter boviskoreani]|jgi:CRISPR-associated exonuclease Cas4|uniref:CRISPR-associated protein Cas4 n=1 Tax=Methanobrevibacter boviskoreani TaxID=1348249 RepID=UPI002588C0F1|nr:Dna2/Cas4 domain-containing protein [Methanobrevibacter boviskoreani]MDY5614778.1 Dna2/Cas4 domain-containing protein [Methanobrevibacter boviskoreani]
MISLKKIKTYMYCPLKLYYEDNIHENEIKNERYEAGKRIKEIRLDIQDLIQRNLKRLNKNMDLKRIEQELSKNINYYINNQLNEIYDPEKYDIEDIEKYKNDLMQESKYNIQLLSLKSKRLMDLTNENGHNITERLFPTAMYNYILRDPELEITGIAEKIEIIQGKYYPIIFKTSIPPIKGVWDSDAIELAFTSILIEEEFETEVYVGFVDYVNIGERRPAVIDANLRKGLFRKIDYVRTILYNKEIPTAKYDLNKCKNCEFKDICLDDYENPIEI